MIGKNPPAGRSKVAVCGAWQGKLIMKKRCLFKGLYLEDCSFTVDLGMTEKELQKHLQGGSDYKRMVAGKSVCYETDTHLWHSERMFHVKIGVSEGKVSSITIIHDSVHVDPKQRYAILQKWLTKLYGKHTFSFADWRWRCKFLKKLRYRWELPNARIVHRVHFYDDNEFYDIVDIQKLSEPVFWGC